MQNYKLTTKTAFSIGLLAYALSILFFQFPFLQGIFFFILITTFALISFNSPQTAVLLLILELVIGNKGYLFYFPVGDFILSLRMAMFVLFIVVWGIKRIFNFQPASPVGRSSIFNQFLLKQLLKQLITHYRLLIYLSLFLGIGLISALENHNLLKLIFFDFNGYFYFALLPIFLLEIKNNKLVIKNIVQIILGGALALSIITIVLFIDFAFFEQDARPDISEAVYTKLSVKESEKEKISQSTYAKTELQQVGFIRETSDERPYLFRWASTTGNFEISYLSGRFFRVFAISHIYVLFAWLFVLFRFLNSKFEIRNFQNSITPKLAKSLTILIIFATILLICFSRSLWLGGISGFIVINLLLWKKILKLIPIYICMGIFGFCIVYFFLPGIWNVLEARVTGITSNQIDPSTQNRMNLYNALTTKIKEHPVIGAGWGTTFMYESVVPEKLGTLRVYQAEWAYLDVFAKIGIVGMLCFLIFYGSIFYYLLKKRKDPQIKFLLAPFISLLVINITTPYLNHPLGIGYVMICIASMTKMKTTYDFKSLKNRFSKIKHYRPNV